MTEEDGSKLTRANSFESPPLSLEDMVVVAGGCGYMARLPRTPGYQVTNYVANTVGLWWWWSALRLGDGSECRFVTRRKMLMDVPVAGTHSSTPP